MKARKSTHSWLAGVVVLYALLAAAYFVLRYEGRWSDYDTANLTKTIVVTDQRGQLSHWASYSWGFSYAALSTFIMMATGLDVIRLQFLVYPIAAAGLSLVAFVMYRQLTGDAYAGILATLFLFMQPDFLFVIFRGSHEKITWLMVVLAVFLLARSFGAMHRLSRFSAYVGLFYLALYALIADSAFFGSSFIAAVGVSLAAGLVMLGLVRRKGGERARSRELLRLVYVIIAAAVLWFWHTFYLYPPAMRFIAEANTTTEQVATMALNMSRRQWEPKFNPYATVSWGWVSMPAYWALVLPSFMVGGGAFLVWIMAGIRHVRRKENLFDEPPRLLLWLLYGGFGLQFAASLLVANVGGAAGNLQVRMFPALMLFSMAMVARPLVPWWHAQARRPARVGLAIVLALLLAWASGASLLKATNDPALSNYWMFLTASEVKGVAWVEDHVRYGYVWLGLDAIRISSRVAAESFGALSGNRYDFWRADQGVRDVLIPDTEEQLSVRRSAPLPDVQGENRVYHNGSVAHYHYLPRTPYQR
ncbi:MAG: hypothetical protein JW850_02235 [Thermoflexales bacterium]|nr:hypothetical protein [Thermoflexales bacterium]